MDIKNGSSIGVLEGHCDQVIYTINEHDPDYIEQIVLSTIPEIVGILRSKFDQYGTTNFDLGIAGQYMSINKKVSELRRIVTNSTDHNDYDKLPDILQGIVGHALIALSMIEDE